MTKPEDLIKKLNMIAHPEGGYFSESFRDDNNNVSLIYYLLQKNEWSHCCLLYTSPSPRDRQKSRMPSSA